MTAAVALAAAPARAQVSPNGAVAVMAEGRAFQFDSGVGAREVVQWTVPLGATFQLHPRLSATAVTSFTRTSFSTYDGWTDDFAGLTDADLHLAYAARAGTLLLLDLTLPTGKRPSANDLPAIGATASNFLTFPVSTFATGGAASAGLALARNVVGVNVAVAAAARFSAGYRPFADDPASFKPATEGRFQLSGDALLGPGHVVAAVTASSFTHDALTLDAAGASASTSYRPGTRLAGALSYAVPVGTGILTGYAWQLFDAAASDSTGGVAAPRERVVDAGVRLMEPLNGALTATPELVVRQAYRADSLAGRTASVGVTGTLRASTSLRVYATARFVRGFVVGAGSALHTNVRGWAFSCGIRSQW